MLNIKYVSEKESLNASKKEILFLAEIEGVKSKVKATTKRQKLNLSLVLDISGSMADVISHTSFPQNLPIPHFGGIQDFGLARNCFDRASLTRTTKLDLAKKAAISAIEKMKDGDFVSLVVFDDKVSVLSESKEITASTRVELINKISLITTRGGTDVHAGWFAGATEVAKTMKEKYINRVLILTDGQTYSGIVDPTTICNNVNALFKKGISTTTFGVGAHFNEDLLQNMSEKGGGNFYYIKEEKDFDDVFSQEFSGLLNVAGSEITLEIQTGEGVKVLKQLNNLVETDGKIVISDIAGGKKVSLLFKLETIIPKAFDSKENFKIGTLVLSYKDESGNKIQTTNEIELPVVKNKKWESLQYNQEVKVQEMLLTIAEEKVNAGNLAIAGNIEGAKSLLRNASALAGSIGISDVRLTASLNSLESTVIQADTMSAGDFKKSVSYDSYRSRTGKDS